jgi:hypothetical protein
VSLRRIEAEDLSKGRSRRIKGLKGSGPLLLRWLFRLASLAVLVNPRSPDLQFQRRAWYLKKGWSPGLVTRAEMVGIMVGK